MAAVARRMNGMETNGRGHTTDDEDEDKHELDDLDAALLQTFIAKRVIYLDNAINTFATLVDATGTFPPSLKFNLESDIQVDQDTFEEAISRINVAIHDFDFEIRKALAQATGSPLYAIVFLS
jgi:Nse1 non-SMC component of SMC5-6 complex